MVSKDSLVGEFKFMGIEKLNDEILIKCIEISKQQKIDAERFVEEWIAFAQTNLGGNLQPSLVTLETMVRKQFDKKPEKSTKKSEPVTPQSNKIKVYNSNNSTDMKNILDAYNTVTPKKTAESKRKQQEELEEVSTFSPASYNPEVSKPSTAYAERTDRGKELEVFGPKELLQQDSQVSLSEHVQVKLLGKHDSWDSSSGRYMFEGPETEARVLNKRIERIGHLLIKKYETDANKGSLTYGRIRCDGEGRLNAHSILLETSLEHGRAESLIVNLQQIPKLSLFPGQIILLQATLQVNSMRQNYLLAQHLYYNAIADLPQYKPNIGEKNRMNIVVASGPYTLSDNLAYQPLRDLIKYVLTNQPHVLILIGPFVDMRHSSVADGTMAETYRSHFQNLMDQVTTPLKDTNIQVVVVPSTLDAHHHSVYPTPPFDQLPKHRFSSNHVHMASDPALVNFNDLIVGVTSADVLFHLAKTEFNVAPYNPDRMARFAEHILCQRSFYPIYPPQQPAPGQHRICIDQQLMNIHGEFDVMPHILILPSNLKQFVKNVNGCIVINPERLSKGFVGGTFASINVYPGQLGLSPTLKTTEHLDKKIKARLRNALNLLADSYEEFDV